MVVAVDCTEEGDAQQRHSRANATPSRLNDDDDNDDDEEDRKEQGELPHSDIVHH